MLHQRLQEFFGGFGEGLVFFPNNAHLVGEAGESGRNVSRLFSEALMIRSKAMAYPRPSSTKREALNSRL